MPNWCYNDITIIGPTEEDAQKFYKNLEEWTSKNYKDNDFGLHWLGNIVGNSGLDDPVNGKYECRGSIAYMDCDSDEISIQTETAWGPMNDMWTALIERDMPDGEFYYMAEEPGMGVYCTNRSELDGKYYYDYWCDDSELTDDELERLKNCELAQQTDDEMSYKDVEKMILELIPVNKKPETEEELFKLWNESNFSSTASIHKWDYEPT